MATNVTDLLFEAKARLAGKVGAGGVTSTSASTIPHTFVGLNDGDCFIVTANRTNATGTVKNQLNETETFIGKVSAGNFIECVREVEGSAQAWAADTVLEILFTATGWNKLIEHLLVQHNQDGTHKSLPYLPTSYLDTDGTLAANSDTKIASQKATKTYIGSAITTAKADLTKYSNLNAPQGFFLNGKIVPSVASNNLTVAIKGMDGNDPSASNPVYVRIGDTVRSITSALSVTKNAGTNWCNAGSAELATKEIDYFVYLGYNATDGVTIGFARIPYGLIYSDFSTTAANEKYCAISTITNAAATDSYEVVGRFAATLSAGAGYTWTVPTFTAKNLIQRPIYNTRTLDFAFNITASGGSPTQGNGTWVGKYKIEKTKMSVEGSLTWGSSTSVGTGSWSFGLPSNDPTTMGTKTVRNRILDFHASESGVDNYSGFLYNFNNSTGRIDGFYRFAGTTAFYDGSLGVNVIPQATTAWSTGDVLDFNGSFDLA